MLPYMDKSGVEQSFKNSAWQKVIYNEIASALSSSERKFPCIFGTSGFKMDQLRYAFADEITAGALAELLAAYLPKARSYGSNTSLVVMERPRSVQTMEDYQLHFWSLLRELRKLDTVEWPRCIPEAIDDPMWEFCFNGEPIFVVCNTPAHLMRQSRRSSAFMLTFQPRWVFDTILSTPEAAELAFAKVRKLLERYDFVERSPSLGLYGDSNNREAHQYFLSDDASPAACPFSSLALERLTHGCL